MRVLKSYVYAVGVLAFFQVQWYFSMISVSFRSLLVNGKKPIIYTYNEESAQTEEDEMLKMWKRVWFDAGWIPKVLNIEDAKKHPSYGNVLENLAEGNGARALQWLSMAQVGGGWLSERDVFPIHDFRNESLPHGGLLTLWENVMPSLVSGSPEEYTRGALLLSEHIQSSGPHSDILALVKLGRATFYNGRTFERERSVISGSAALESNLSNCFEGKRAIHFTPCSSDDSEHILQWLDMWRKSNCSQDLQSIVSDSGTGNTMLQNNANSVLESTIHDVNGQESGSEEEYSRSLRQRKLVPLSAVSAKGTQMNKFNFLNTRVILQGTTNNLMSQNSAIRMIEPESARNNEYNRDLTFNAKVTTSNPTFKYSDAHQEDNVAESSFAGLKVLVKTPTLQSNVEDGFASDHSGIERTVNRSPSDDVQVSITDPDELHFQNQESDGARQQRLLKKKMFPTISIESVKWDEMMKAAAMDENLLNSLAKKSGDFISSENPLPKKGYDVNGKEELNLVRSPLSDTAIHGG